MIGWSIYTFSDMQNLRFLNILSYILIATSVVHIFPVALFAENFVGTQKSQSAIILDRFKESEKVLLFETSPFPKWVEQKLFLAERKANSLAQMLNRVNETKDQYKEMKKNVVEKKISLKDAIAQIEQDMSATQAEIEKRERDSIGIEANIRSTQNRVNVLQEKISTSKAILLQYLEVIYTKWDVVFDSKNQDVDLLKTIVMNSSDAARVLDDIYSQALLELAGKEFIDNYRSAVAALYQENLSLQKQKEDLELAKKDLENYQIALDDQKEYKEAILLQTKSDESQLNNLIIERSESSEKLAAHLSEVSNVYQKTFEEIAAVKWCSVNEKASIVLDSQSSTGCITLASYFEAEKKIMTSVMADDSSNPLSWPVASSRISSYFHDGEYYEALGSHHDAIDIPVAQSTDIASPADGYVYYINPPTKTWYGYVAIKHPNGFMTVYGHISSVNVEKFDVVKRGQIIAQSGGARGTVGAGPMTSGPHLHFEVFKDGEAVDPLQYMNISNLEPKWLTERYLDKYAADYFARFGVSPTMTDAPSTFMLSGATEVDRQKYLLKTYATPAFQNWDMWTDESLAGGIDPAFMMCVGLAETGLGRHLKTGYNVGNIGNTDSGDVRTFGSPQLWVRMMAKTLNNRYLGNYTKVSELSRYGNLTWPIYASSSKNWHANVTRCLSAVKGRYVSDDTIFRMNVSLKNNE